MREEFHTKRVLIAFSTHFFGNLCVDGAVYKNTEIGNLSVTSSITLHLAFLAVSSLIISSFYDST